MGQMKVETTLMESTDTKKQERNTNGNGKYAKEEFKMEPNGFFEGHIKDIVYGGLDGLVTTFAIVSGVAGASYSSSVVLVLGLANLFADGVSMGVGNYMGTKSEIEVAKYDLSINNSMKGLDEDTISQMVDCISSSDRLWVDTLLAEEEEILDVNKSPLKAALITFLSFFLIGLIPLSTYILAIIWPQILPQAFEITIALTIVTTFTLGVMKSRITDVNWLSSGCEMLLCGGAAAVVAYLVGYIFSDFDFKKVGEIIVQ